MTAPPPLLALQGKYRLLRQLADAGALEQYLGATRGANRHLAVIKRVPLSLAKNKPTVGAFLDEARTTARLRHPAIVQVLEVGDDGGTVAAAFEHVFGADAEQLLRAEQVARRALPIPVVLAITAAVLDALGHAHQAVDDGGAPLRLVHRDVSARNVILGYDGAIKLTGFGMAKHQARSEHTSFGVVRGQLAYVSPEQLKSGEVDARADLWAVGVLL